MTFGYDAEIMGTWNNKGVLENAIDLLERLINKREEKVGFQHARKMANIYHVLTSIQGRPIIFICHSLGGLVVKRVSCSPKESKASL
jgi:hypothetical protein